MPSIRVTTLILCGCLVCHLPAGRAAERLVWFGTYTNPPAKSEGIYVSRFDDEAGTLTPPTLAAAVKNPSFLAVHPLLPVLCAVAEVSTVDGRPGAAITAFGIDATTGRLTEKNHQPTGGGGACHVCFDHEGRVVLAANYGGGSAICLGVAEDGSLEPVAAGTPGGFIQHTFSRAGAPGVHAQRQEKPHAHSVDVSADGRFAFMCDLGLDEVLVYTLDRDRATLAPHATATVKAGAGPRHFALHPDGRSAWCVNELDLTVTGFAYDAASGTLTVGETLSTIPANVVDRTGFSTAEIAVHPSGKFLYASNRGHHSIATYTIDGSTRRLTFQGVEPIRGKTPRSFAIDPTGRHLLAAGQDSNTVTVFAIDPATGALRFTGASIEVPAPVCVTFARDK